MRYFTLLILIFFTIGVSSPFSESPPDFVEENYTICEDGSSNHLPGSYSGNSREDYINHWKRYAQERSDITGIPASIKLAQAILESGNGTSSIATKANNHFCIKAWSNWEGAIYYQKDDDYRDSTLIKSPFRYYSKPIDSWKDHDLFLQQNQRYSKLWVSNHYIDWANGLQEAGYASNPNYGKLLIQIIEKHDLWKLDYR